MKSGRGADVRCITLEFKGVLVLGEGICLVLKQPGVVARNGFNERVLSDPLKNTEASNNIKVTTPGKHATSRKNVPVGQMTRVNL